LEALVIFGAGSVAQLALRYFATDSPYRVVAFTVDDDRRSGDRFEGLPLVGWSELPRLFPPGECDLFIALGYSQMNRARATKYEAGLALGYRLASYVSTRCSYLTEREPGDNCFVLEDNTIQQEARLGNDVFLWSGNHIGHHAVIEDHCFVSSHVVVSGHARVGAFSFLGVNATIHNGVTVAPRTLVGAGAVICGDTAEGSVWVPPRSICLPKDSDDVEL
jgi:sugar O-acyltransferase (sialic acid O-acetyltransferase NeuD family)